MIALGIQINGDCSSLSIALNKAQEKVDQFAKRFKIGLQNVFEANVYQKFLQMAEGALAAPFEKLKASFEQGAELEALHQRTGAGIKDLVALRKAFKESDIDAGMIGPTINKLQSALGGMNEQGEETSSIFHQLGISTKELREKSPTAQLLAVGNAINKLGDASQRAYAARKIFGKGGGEMLQLFNNKNAMADAAKGGGTFGEIMERNAALFHRINYLIEAAGGKMKQFFAGLATGVAPGLLPILEAFNQLDFAKWGQQIGAAVAIFFQAFKDGSLMEFVATSLKIGAMKGINVLDHVLRGVMEALPEYFAFLIENLGEGFKMLTTPAFWRGLIFVLAGAATKFEAYMMSALTTPLLALKSGFQYLAEILRNLLIDAFNGPIAFLRGGMNFVLQELFNGLLRIPGMSKLLGMDEVHQSWKQFQDEAKKDSSTADSVKTDPNLRKIFNDNKADGLTMFGTNAKDLSKLGDQEMSQGGSDLLPLLKQRLADLKNHAQKIAGSFMQGFRGKDAFDTSAEEKKLSGMIAKLEAHAKVSQDKAIAQTAAAHPGGIEGEKLAQKEKSGVIASSLAKIGGGGNFAAGSLGLQREANGYLRKIESHLGKLQPSHGVKTSKLDLSPSFA